MVAFGKRLRRWLYLGHRWLGIVTCLLFAVWFLSGIVMMYVGFPRLTDAERRAAQVPIVWDRVSLEPDAAVALAGLDRSAVRRLDLTMFDAAPVYRVTPWSGPRRTVSAVTGEVLGTVSAGQALAVARHHPVAVTVSDLGLVTRDQWTVPQRFDPLRPFHRIALGDAADTQLYVSAATGEIALDTSRHERFWNWFGAVPHWIYFTPLRSQVELWRDVVLWLSGISVVGALIGFVVGVMRVRLRRRYAKGARTPYRGWMAWHHLGGLVAGVTLFAFIFSGWISMNPNRWFSPREPERAELERYQGIPETPTNFDLRALADVCSGATEARFTRIDGQGHVILACPWNTEKTCCDPMSAPSPERIARAAARLIPTSPPPQIERLTDDDVYWYSHHQERKLPVLRIQFSDPAATWFHIHPATGEILNRIDRSNRIYRWLFNAFHSFDFVFLVRYRPAWDLVLLALSAGGLAIALSGIVIGWRRLRATLRRRVSTPT